MEPVSTTYINCACHISVYIRIDTCTTREAESQLTHVMLSIVGFFSLLAGLYYVI